VHRVAPARPSHAAGAHHADAADAFCPFGPTGTDVAWRKACQARGPTHDHLLSVPIIDLAPYFAGTAEGKAQVANKVDEACRSIGFLVITHHGIPARADARVSQLSRRFFDMPLAEKRKVDRPREDAVRGYSAVGEEGLSYSLEEAAPGDLKESFSIGPSNVPHDDYHRGPAAGPHFEPNSWPPIDGFREAYEAYFEAMSDLSRSLMRIFALGLRCPRPSSTTRSTGTSACSAC
jgi:isopenicillin N synthase-like dioxygenase